MSTNDFDPFEGFDGDESDDNQVIDPLTVTDDDVDAEFEWIGEDVTLVFVDKRQSRRQSRVPVTARTTEAQDGDMGEFQGQEMRPSSGQMGQAKAEANAPETDLSRGPEMSERIAEQQILDLTPEEMEGSAVVARERALSREWEAQRTHLRLGADDREERTREVVTEMGVGDPDGTPVEDLKPTVPLGGLPADVQEEAARESVRIMEKTGTPWTAPVIQQKLGDRLRAGQSMDKAVLNTAEEVPPAGPDDVVDIGDLGDVNHYRVQVEGELVQLWESTHPDIHQVGLLADDSGTTKMTVWKSAVGRGLTSTYSEPGRSRWHEGALNGELDEGDEVRLTEAKRTFHGGNTNLEIDRRSHVGVLKQANPGSGEFSPHGYGSGYATPGKRIRQHRGVDE